MQPADFTFKQFAIWHDKCAMKVSTDGILLGAWAAVKPSEHIIDIGTGTGLIALMLAQRSNTLPLKPLISAVDIEASAVTQAKFNVSQSPWHTRIQVHHCDINEFVTRDGQAGKYQTLVSNPPYFSNALQAKDAKRNLARHNQNLSFTQLLQSAQLLASNTAQFHLILPCEEADRLINQSQNTSWRLTKRIEVSTVTGKRPSRSLLTLQNHENKLTLETGSFAIRNNQNQYTEEFVAICRDFYLAM